MQKQESATHWYASKVFFNKVFEIEALLREREIECYVPCETVLVEKKGAKKKQRKPIISSLLFFRSTESEALDMQKSLHGRILLYTRNEGLRRLPSAIPEHEMNVFVLVTSSGEKGIEYMGDDSPEFHTGERVRVIDGSFKGAEGCIRRIRGDHRLIVSVRGVCAIATTYIPQCFLQRINGGTSGESDPSAK